MSEWAVLLGMWNWCPYPVKRQREVEVANIFQCSMLWENYTACNAQYVISHPCPHLYVGQQSVLFPYVEFSKKKVIPRHWFSALNFVYLKFEEYFMPFNKPAPQKSKKPDYGIDLINFNLSDDELTAFDQWLEKNIDQFHRTIVDVLVSEIKIGMSIDGINSCFICSFTPKNEHDINAGKCLCSRSDEWEEAFFMNVYKCKLFDEANDGKWEHRNHNRKRG